MKISTDPAIDRKLEGLIYILLEEGYFVIPSNAEAYVQAIYDFIDTIPRKALRPIKNSTSTSYYCQYKPNKCTTWYIVYEMEEDDYLITDPLNNHSQDYNDFITKLK